MTSLSIALYKYNQFLGHSADTVFDQVAAHSGIYRCDGCGREISHNAGLILPPQTITSIPLPQAPSIRAWSWQRRRTAEHFVSDASPDSASAASRSEFSKNSDAGLP
jgi:hypothetical protein